MNLLEKMKVSIDTMSFGEKFLASIQVTLLGIGIVFIALAILYFTIVIMEKLISRKPQPVVEKAIIVEPSTAKTEVSSEPVTEPLYEEEDKSVDDTELIAVIAAAIAASLNVPTQKVVVKGIRRIYDPTPTWAKMGRIEQINNML